MTVGGTNSYSEAHNKFASNKKSQHQEDLKVILVFVLG